MTNCKVCNTELILGKNITQSYLNNSDYKCRDCRKVTLKAWHKQNPGKDLEYTNKWYNANKEKNNEWRKEYQKKRFHDLKDGNHYVYLLKDNYVGVTGHLADRGNKHRYERNQRFMCVLYQTEDRSEALELEALLHDEGYKGKHNNLRYA